MSCTYFATDLAPAHQLFGKPPLFVDRLLEAQVIAWVLVQYAPLDLVHPRIGWVNAIALPWAGRGFFDLNLRAL